MIVYMSGINGEWSNMQQTRKEAKLIKFGLWIANQIVISQDQFRFL